MIKPVDNTDYSATNQADNLCGVRRRLLRGMLIAFVVLGLPAVGISCIEAIKLGQLGGVMLYGGIYLIVSVTAIYFHRLPFAFCAGVMLASLYVIAVFNFLHFSFAGAGIEILITISVLATVLLGMRSGFITAATCLSTIITIGLCFVYGAIDVSPEMVATTTKIISWVTAAAVFALLTGALILSSGRLQGYLIKSLASVRFKTEELKEANKNLIQEIKQRKMAEAKLKQSEAQFRTLFETAPDAIYLIDLEGTLLDGNHKAEALIESPLETFIGKNFIDTGLLPKTEISKAVTIMEKSRKSESTGPDELTLISSVGKATTVEILTSPFQLEDRPVMLGIARDVSERKRLENLLNQTQKMESIGQLAGGIAHDFNNVLYPIIGFTQMSIEDLPKTHPIQENLQDILSGAKRARDLVKKILLFSRQKKQELKSIIIRPVIEEAIRLLRSTIPTNIDIQSQLYDGKDYIMCDETEIHEIVLNLCTNAHHAIEDISGKIIVSLKKMQPDSDSHLPSGEYICLSISDNGTGIPEEIKDKLFEPYFTTKEVGKGSGMGLAVVHGIVKNYKGDIQVESHPEKGTTFSIFLPITSKTTDIEQEKEKVNPLLGTENILFVDDEKSIVKLGIRTLERLGYKVTGVQDSSEALTLFKSKPENFDIVITDMAMPVMEGTELAQKIFEIRQDIPIILCSGFSEKIDHDKASRFNIKAFIDKPILGNDLTTKVRELLDQSDGGKYE